MNSNTILNLAYLDPPQYGWTAVGGIASILEPHERARRVNVNVGGVGASKPPAASSGGNATDGITSETSAAPKQQECYYTIINDDDDACETKQEETKEDEAKHDDTISNPPAEEEKSPSTSRRRKGKSLPPPSTEIEADAPKADVPKADKTPEKINRPKRISIQRLHENTLDIYTYHRGRVGQEPRDANGELLAQLDPVDTNHDWTPTNPAVVKILLDFPLVDDLDDENDDETRDGKDVEGNAMDKRQYRFYDTVSWNLLDPTMPTPEEFATDLATQYCLSFRTTMEIIESITRQICDYVKRKTNRFYPPIVIRDAYGNERPDRQFGCADDVTECFRGVMDGILEAEGGARRGGGRAVISRRNDAPAKKREKVGKVREKGQVKPQRGTIEVIPKDKVPQPNQSNDIYAAQVLHRAKSASQKIVNECKSRGDKVLWHAEGEVCHICHNRKPVVLTFHCGCHSYCDYHCASRLSFRCRDYDPNNPDSLPIDHCPVCTLQCTCSKCTRLLDEVTSKLKTACEEQNCPPDQVVMPRLLEFCSAKLTSTPKMAVEPKGTPFGGVLKKKMNDPAKSGGSKRSRSKDATGDAHSTRSSPLMGESSDSARPQKKRKVDRQPSTKTPVKVLRVNPTEFPKEFYDGKDMDPAEPGDYERCFTPFGSLIPDPSLTANDAAQKFQDIIPLPSRIATNFDSCIVCNAGGKVTHSCAKCPRSYHTECLVKDGGDSSQLSCHRCKMDRHVLVEDLSNITPNQLIKMAYDNNLADFAWYEKIMELLVEIINKLKAYDFGAIFAEPVNTELVPNYLDVIKRPMDYGEVIKKLERGRYPNTVLNFTYKEKMNEMEEIVLHALCDIEQVHHNCMLFNENGSCYHRVGQVHMVRWKAYYEKVIEDRLPPNVQANLEEFRAVFKEELDSKIQVRILTATNPTNRANITFAVFDPITKKVVKQYTSKSAAVRAAMALKKAGYACEYELDDKNVKSIIEKSSKEASTLLFGYRWMTMDCLRSGEFKLEEKTTCTDNETPFPVRSDSLASSFFQDDALMSPSAGNIVVLKEDTASGCEMRGFDSEEAAYKDWLETCATAVHLDPSIASDMSTFQQHFLHGTKTINGVAWKLAERSEAATHAAPSLSQEKVVMEQEYAVPVKEKTSVTLTHLSSIEAVDDKMKASG
eukprot:CCRYP_005173-RB/>CCRYP_005173-RB protein AED:0.11 eAED:0.11 QI:59/1/1/1/0.5/0.4/5/2459/1160